MPPFLPNPETPMPYVRRDTQGSITAIVRDDTGASEALDLGDPQLRSFLGADPRLLSDFERLDVDFVRVLEDLIDALTARHLINITDLPESAQAKLMARRSFRERHSEHALQLFDDTGLSDVI
jgi:hypothetical protein